MSHQLKFFTGMWLTFFGIDQEKGQGLVEYALILLLIALAVIGGLLFFRSELINIYSEISSEIGTVSP